MAKYADLLGQNKDERAQAGIASKVARAKAEVQKKAAEIDARIASVQEAYNEALRAENFNVDVIFNRSNELAQLEADQKAAANLLSELF